MAHSLFANVKRAPRDPILGLNEMYNADTRSTKVNLGVGVYSNEAGKIPLLACVNAAEKARLEAQLPRGYQPIEGSVAYNRAVQQLLLGEEHPALQEQRVVTAQALGGTGALKIGADFLYRINPEAKVYISDPSWENHRALFEAAGFEVISYPYYDAKTRGADVAGMLAYFNTLTPGSIVVLHACCHNPTGVDLTAAQWQNVLDCCQERQLVPFLDAAYQGFAEGIVEDSQVIRLFAQSGLPCFISNSFSKNFSLYGERVGALSIVTSSQEEAARVLSQLKRVIRTNYSNPPIHGAAIVADVLNQAQWRQEWEKELGAMRIRIRSMREGLVQAIKEAGVRQDFSFITKQRGMFSYTGLSSEQVERLKVEFGIYAVSTGRICLAALNNNNLAYVASAVAKVL